MRMKKIIHTNNMKFKIFKGCNLPKPQKKDYYEREEVRRGKRSHGEIKEENIIQIDYKRIKITNHSLYCKQNYNLLKKCFNSLIIIFTTNKN